MKTAVDIVMRTRNRPQFLSRALDDVLAQTFDDWTLIVVNDGGDAQPVEEALAARPGLDGRTRLVHRPDAEAGRGSAINPGIEAGDSPFVVWHDDDDTWRADFLQRTVAHLQDTDDVAVAVRTEIVFEREVDGGFEEISREVWHPLMQEPTYFDLLRFNHVVPISLLYRREVHERIGLVDPALGMVEDWEFNMRLLHAGRMGFLDDGPLAYWHQRPHSRGDSANSVITERPAHRLHDRRVRGGLLQEEVDAVGSGPALYATGHLDEHFADLTDRMDGFEEGLARLEGILRARL